MKLTEGERERKQPYLRLVLFHGRGKLAFLLRSGFPSSRLNSERYLISGNVV